MRVIQGEEPHSVGSSETKPEPQPEEDDEQAARYREYFRRVLPRIDFTSFQPCMRCACRQSAAVFCATCGGDLCADHDYDAHMGANGRSISHARVRQADKGALLKAMAGAKSAATCKIQVQRAVRDLAAMEVSLDKKTKEHEGQRNTAPALNARLWRYRRYT